MAMDLLRLLAMAPTAVKLGRSLREATAELGPAGLPVWAMENWRDAVQMIAPGYLPYAENAMQAIGSVRGQETVIEGEYRVVDPRPPWHHFQGWLERQRWGTYVILGPMGTGKTTLAARLAQVWHENTRWPVEVVNTYPEDLFPWMTPIQTESFKKRIKTIATMLDKEPPQEEDKKSEYYADLFDKLEGYKRRIIILDEASLLMGTSGQDSGRRLVGQIRAQARHLNWNVILIAQTTKMLPKEMLNSMTIFIKQPSGLEKSTDRTDEKIVQMLWAWAEEGFRTVNQLPWYRRWPHADLSDKRAWSFAFCNDMGGGQIYSGMMPVLLPTEDLYHYRTDVA